MSPLRTYGRPPYSDDEPFLYGAKAQDQLNKVVEFIRGNLPNISEAELQSLGVLRNATWLDIFSSAPKTYHRMPNLKVCMKKMFEEYGYNGAATVAFTKYGDLAYVHEMTKYNTYHEIGTSTFPFPMSKHRGMSCKYGRWNRTMVLYYDPNFSNTEGIIVFVDRWNVIPIVVLMTRLHSDVNLTSVSSLHHWENLDSNYIYNAFHKHYTQKGVLGTKAALEVMQDLKHDTPWGRFDGNLDSLFPYYTAVDDNFRVANFRDKVYASRPFLQVDPILQESCFVDFYKAVNFVELTFVPEGTIVVRQGHITIFFHVPNGYFIEYNHIEVDNLFKKFLNGVTTI